MPSCKWTEHNDPDYWDTSCGQSFCLMEGTPEQNGMRFCPYCGRPIDGNPAQEDEE